SATESVPSATTWWATTSYPAAVSRATSAAPDLSCRVPATTPSDTVSTLASRITRRSYVPTSGPEAVAGGQAGAVAPGGGRLHRLALGLHLDQGERPAPAGAPRGGRPADSADRSSSSVSSGPMGCSTQA